LSINPWVYFFKGKDSRNFLKLVVNVFLGGNPGSGKKIANIFMVNILEMKPVSPG
jgi:hypothetical protein